MGFVRKVVDTKAAEEQQKGPFPARGKRDRFDEFRAQVRAARHGDMFEIVIGEKHNLSYYRAYLRGIRDSGLKDIIIQRLSNGDGTDTVRFTCISGGR